MRKTFPETDNLQRTTKFFYSPTFRQSEAGIPIGPNSSTPASSRHMLNLYTTPEPAFEVQTHFMSHWLSKFEHFKIPLPQSLFEQPLCFQVLCEKDTLYLHLLFALKDPSVGTLESNFASTVFYAFCALQVLFFFFSNGCHCLIKGPSNVYIYWCYYDYYLWHH